MCVDRTDSYFALTPNADKSVKENDRTDEARTSNVPPIVGPIGRQGRAGDRA